MKKKILEKWNRRGASLAEMLVTLVILSLALSTVTGALAASSSSYKTCRLEANAQTLLSTQINAIAGYLYTSTPEMAENGTTLKCIYDCDAKQMFIFSPPVLQSSFID